MNSNPLLTQLTPATLDEHADSVDLESLPAEERERVVRRSEALKALLTAPPPPKYKIEVYFSGRYTRTAPIVGVLSIWASGAALSGEGDVKLYMCPQRALGLGLCNALVSDASTAADASFLCPACHTRWHAREVIGELVYRMDLYKWPEVLQQVFVRLGMDASVILKIDEVGMRGEYMKEQEKYRAGELLQNSRRQRKKRVYTKEAILRDANGGKSFLELFRGFLYALPMSIHNPRHVHLAHKKTVYEELLRTLRDKYLEGPGDMKQQLVCETVLPVDSVVTQKALEEVEHEILEEIDDINRDLSGFVVMEKQ